MAHSAEESCESFSSQPLNHVTLPIDEVTTKEQLKLCCKPRYKIRRVKTKGAILVLIWNFLASFVLWYIISSWYRSYKLHNYNGTVISAASFGLTLPLAGWLADACIGRYKMIYCSALIMWVATILETLSEMLLDGYYTSINDVATQVLLGLMGLGLGGFLSTVMQFGIDQLYDASADEISAFIMWYVWSWTAPLFTINLTFTYLRFDNQRFILFGNLIFFLIFSAHLELFSFICTVVYN